MDIESLLERLLAGERAAISEALNLVDDQRSEQREWALELLDRLSAQEAATRAHVVGLTGAPGAGKSSLLNALVESLREASSRVGIIAVDPSSQRSGGALLGDRMRLSASAREAGVFLRSMAARDRLGGLADATRASTVVLCASFDWVFIETVGIGQSECEVAQLVDSLVFVAQPGAGDTLQFMKAGILELPDIFVVNKADTGAVADRTRTELGGALQLAEASATPGWKPPLLSASARDRTGIEEVQTQIEAHAEATRASGDFARRRKEGQLAFATESLLRRYGEWGLAQIGGTHEIGRRLERAEGRSAFGIVLDLGREIEAALGQG
ncbi:MAG: methylmalonyl Co-A mutase-associated GTPase MeaB [Myxococcota bacterium]|nr:methylmalonyl Co-A mutase-associated GTPase MeaB [Spirochaeta sp.]RPG11790.1 MAG: methylmalonyl Co-A mutase-associated GTPase MeaB [Proteobacteria bacterium TMED72]